MKVLTERPRPLCRGTWHRNPAVPGDAVIIQRNFAGLRSLVDQARRRRAAWVLGVPAAGFVMLVTGGPLGTIIQALTGR
ncbi:hypothetical protein [Arthrobacter sp. UYEF36]|uniref:hypothetical protein n=1 Tax=Arthrobacter sp. UYEF36 TaxID=1756366 RepID=UPI0033924AB4